MKCRWLNNLTAVSAAVVLSVGLAACGGGSSTTMDDSPDPTPYEMAVDAIAAAETAEAAQAAYDAVKDSVTAAEGDKLQDAVDERVDALQTMARAADQRMDLETAAAAVDTSSLETQAEIDAAKAAIGMLQAAIDAAVDVDDTSMYASQVSAADMAVASAEDALALDGRRTDQMAGLTSASTALTTALDAISGTPTQAQIDDANMALTALSNAIEAAEDLNAAETADARSAVARAEGIIEQAETTLMANNEAEAKRKAEEEEEARLAAEAKAKADAAAMAVTASKLYAGIGATPLVGHTVVVDSATGVWSVNPADVEPANLDNQELTADEDTMVAANHGWTGTRHTASGDAVTGTYEAVVYSHLDDPVVTDGLAFNAQYTNLDATTGVLTNLEAGTGGAGVERVASPSFDQSAGEKIFELGDKNQVEIAGSYHGVPGTYYCTPGAGEACGATVADMGFVLGGGTWTFKPTNPEAKLMDTSTPDVNYASYGWWLHKSEDGETFTASAFDTYRGTDPGTVDIDTLRGSATYKGGAAGKYSLRGDTGGTNDAGHFTAVVTLNAIFAETHSIKGTVSNFMGADGMARDWSVALGNSVIADGGAIAGGLNDDGTVDNDNTGNQMTTWTIGDTAGDAGGEWSGNLREEGDDGVPAIATGTFFSIYGDGGNDGRMVGAFGANVE